MANSKDDIEILDFVDNELMEISQEELDNMQNMFDELEASSSDSDDSDDGAEAESLVVQPKSVDTRFAEPVDEAELAALGLDTMPSLDGEEDEVEEAEAPVEEVADVAEAAEEAAPEAQEIKELSLDTADVMAEIGDVDAMLKDTLGDIDLDDFDADDLSAELDESLLSEPAPAEAEEEINDEEIEKAAAEAIAELEEEDKKAKEEKKKEANSLDFDDEGEPILDLEGVPVDEEDISEITTILSKPDNNDLVDDNLLDMFETAQVEKATKEYGENLPEVGDGTFKQVVDEEEAIEEGDGPIEIVTETAVDVPEEIFDDLPHMDDSMVEPIEAPAEESLEDIPEKPKKEKKKKEKKPKKEVEEELDEDDEGKKKLSLWDKIMAFLFESADDDEAENAEGEGGEGEEGAEGEGGGKGKKKAKKEKKKKEKKSKKGKGGEGEEGEGGEEGDSSKKKSKKDKGGDEEGGEGEEGDKKKKKKEKKPKKEKSLEEELKPRQKGISNKAVAAIMLVCLSIAAAIIVLCYFGPRKMAIDKANYQLYNGEYEEAALTLYGMNLNENDTLVFRKASLLNAVNTKFNQYDRFMAINREDKALDALFKTITYCDTKKVDAENLGVKEEVNIVRQGALDILSNKYGVTEEQAEEICQMRPIYYTSAIESIMRGLSYDAFDPLDEESQQRAYDAQMESITGGNAESTEGNEAVEEPLADPIEGEPAQAPADERPDLLPEESAF